MNDKIALLDSVLNNMRNKRRPINIVASLTNECNFKCIYCYNKPNWNKKSKALSVSEWKHILHESKINGCIFLTLTGGEPLLCEYFNEIYEYAYDMNLKIKLITNFSILNKSTKLLLLEKPPETLSVTLYGISNETYNSFCKVHNGWDLTMKNIEFAKSEKLPLSIHTVLNNYNYHELALMKNFCMEMDLPFNIFRYITMDKLGGSQPLDCQLSVEKIVDSYKLAEDSQTFINNFSAKEVAWENGYKMCYAGITSCDIDYLGNMYLCNQCAEHSFNVIELGFLQCWDELLNIRQKKIEKVIECGQCNFKIYCGQCTPAFNKIKKEFGFPLPACHDKYKHEWKHNKIHEMGGI